MSFTGTKRAIDNDVETNTKKIKTNNMNTNMNMDMMNLIKEYSGGDVYLSLAMSRSWKEGWGSSPKMTRAFVENTSKEHLGDYLSSFGAWSNVPMSAATNAAGSGRLDIMNFLLRNRVSRDLKEIVKSATRSGHLHILKSIPLKTDRLKKGMCNLVLPIAVECGHLDIIHWFEDIKGVDEFLKGTEEFRINVCKMASSIGNMDVFKEFKLVYDDFADDDDADREDAWDGYREDIQRLAIEGGHLNFLKYAVVEAGCSFISDPFLFLKSDQSEMLEWMIANSEEYLAEPWTSSGLPYKAASDGDLELLKLCMEHGAELDENILLEISEEHNYVEMASFVLNL